jgi:hypothetical protein
MGKFHTIRTTCAETTEAGIYAGWSGTCASRFQMYTQRCMSPPATTQGAFKKKKIESDVYLADGQ